MAHSRVLYGDSARSRTNIEQSGKASTSRHGSGMDRRPAAQRIADGQTEGRLAPVIRGKAETAPGRNRSAGHRRHRLQVEQDASGTRRPSLRHEPVLQGAETAPTSQRQVSRELGGLTSFDDRSGSIDSEPSTESDDQ